VTSSAMSGDSHRSLSRRELFAFMAAGGAAFALGSSGCSRKPRADAGKVELVWGDRGNRPGHLQKPRGAVVDSEDRIYISDQTDRIQVFSTKGEFLTHWRLPAFDVDGPTGLNMDSDGNLMVADTHFYRILFYTPEGELVRKIETTQGTELGQFGYVRDVVQSADGYYYTCEYGAHDRVQVIAPDGEFIREWGSQGYEPGQFYRPEGVAFDRQGRLFVADSANHRIQIFTTTGELLGIWGEEGDSLDQLRYPHDLGFDSGGNLYVCEWGNCRVQKFSSQGKSLGAWGGRGGRPGKLSFPWALAIDERDRIHVADSGNHRFQTIVL